MEALVEHLVKPIVGNPDDIQINVIEGNSTVLFELIVNDDDKSIFTDEDDRTLRAIRNVLSAAAGKKKTTLELVEEFSAADSMSDEDDDDSEEADDDSDETDDDSEEDDDSSEEAGDDD